MHGHRPRLHSPDKMTSNHSRFETPNHSRYKMPNHSPWQMPNQRSGTCESTDRSGASKMREPRSEPSKISWQSSGRSRMHRDRSGPCKTLEYKTGPCKTLEHKIGPHKMSKHRRSGKASVYAIRAGRDTSVRPPKPPPAVFAPSGSIHSQPLRIDKSARLPNPSN